MEIINLTFEEALHVSINNQDVIIRAFPLPEHGHIKFGINAPRTVKVHREEIHQAIREKEKNSELVMDSQES